MSRVARIVAGIALGAGAGVLLMLVRPNASESKPVRFLRQPHLSLEQNKQPLAPRELAVLVRWTRRYRNCALAAGTKLEEPVTGANEITISPTKGTRIRIRDLAGCERIGVPPLLSALVLARDGRLHVYRPRTCSLPPAGGA